MLTLDPMQRKRNARLLCGWWHGPRAEGLLGVLLEQEAVADVGAEPERWLVAVDETVPNVLGRRAGRGGWVGCGSGASRCSTAAVWADDGGGYFDPTDISWRALLTTF